MKFPAALTANLRFLVGVGAGFLAVLLGARELAGHLGWDAIHPTVRPNHAERLLAYTLRDVREDVLLIGSSRVGGGLHAWLLQERLRERTGRELDVYKLALPGIRPRVLSEVLTGPVSRRPPRELLVIAVEPRFFCRPEKIADAPADAPDAVEGEWQADDALAGDLDLFEGLRSLWVGGWALRAEVREPALAQAQRLGEKRDRAEKRQHLIDSRRLVARLDADNLVLPPGFRWAWSGPDEPDQVGWRRTLEALEDLPCEVLFVRMPLVAGFDAEHMPDVFARYEAEIVTAIEAAGHAYEDLNRRPFPRQERWFTSLTHLDYDGASKTSRVLVDEILGPLLDREP